MYNFLASVRRKYQTIGEQYAEREKEPKFLMNYSKAREAAAKSWTRILRTDTHKRFLKIDKQINKMEKSLIELKKERNELYKEMKSLRMDIKLQGSEVAPNPEEEESEDVPTAPDAPLQASGTAFCASTPLPASVPVGSSAEVLAKAKAVLKKVSEVEKGK